MSFKYLYLAIACLALVLTACSEPRRTPDGHLMDRPPVSAYGAGDVTSHDMGAADDDVEEDE